MKNFILKSKLSLFDTLFAATVAVLLILVLSHIEDYSLSKTIFLCLFAFAASTFWAGLEIQMEWKNNTDVKPKTLSDVKNELIQQIKGNSTWYSRTPQQEEFNSILTNSIKKIELAIEEVEGATQEYISKNKH